MNHVAEIDQLLDELNSADPDTVWDTVIYPRLSPTERDLLTADMIRRGTFIHHHIPYGRAHYTGTWTTLLINADLNSTVLELLDTAAPSPGANTGLTCRAHAVSTGTPGYPQTTPSAG